MRTSWTALLAAGAALAVLAGCQSATRTNLAEYESLVARRRNPAPSATPMAVRAAQEKAEAEARAAEARAKEAEARAARAEAEAAAAKAKAAAAEKAAARRAAEKASAEKKAAAERQAAEERRVAADRRAAEEKAAAEARRAAEARKAAEKKAEAEREARAAREEAARRAEEEAAVAIVAPPTAAPAPKADAGNTAYVLAVGDAVHIILRGIPGGESIEDIIDEGGYVTLPLINEIQAAGCTATQLEKAIRDTYRERRIYKDINVQVLVPTRYYYMQGEIRGPGRVQLVSAVRLSQAIAANGGGTEFWNGKVVVKRNDGRIVNVKNARRLERTPEEDILLEPGDIVELKRSWF